MTLALLPNAEFAARFVYLCAFEMSSLKRKLRFHLQKRYFQQLFILSLRNL
jgi:hypothetical protein